MNWASASGRTVARAAALVEVAPVMTPEVYGKSAARRTPPSHQCAHHRRAVDEGASSAPDEPRITTRHAGAADSSCAQSNGEDHDPQPLPALPDAKPAAVAGAGVRWCTRSLAAARYVGRQVRACAGDEGVGVVDVAAQLADGFV